MLNSCVPTLVGSCGTSLCSSFPCLNEGICLETDSGANFKCRCLSGFSGIITFLSIRSLSFRYSLPSLKTTSGFSFSKIRRKPIMKAMIDL